MSNGSVENPVANVQQWLEKEIIGRGFCPPLVRLARDSRNAEGKIDWVQLSKEVVLDDLTKMEPGGRNLLATTVEGYLGFISGSVEGTAPLTRAFIFPDFNDNSRFDTFLAESKKRSFAYLTGTRERLDFAKLTYRTIAAIQNAPKDLVDRDLRRGLEWIAAAVIEGAFNTINFYGRQVSDRDVSDFPDTMGPVERYKVLARAPYYIMQVANPLRAGEVTSALYTPTLRRRNTAVSLGINIDEYEGIINNFRQ